MKAGRRIGVLGIGNVLMGDDGVGPYAIKLLEARYEFPEEVRLEDLGTPGLGITAAFAEYDSIILIDAVSAKKKAGEVQLYRKNELVQVPLKTRVSPHDPALVEALLFAEFSGKCPQDVLLVGVVPQACELGCGMSDAAHIGLEAAIRAVLTELERLGVEVKLKSLPDEPAIWWEKDASTISSEEGLAHVPGHPR
ncbi:MAG TPA: hydrogenase maturation protease [Candidatus Eisenbacteria bacterium]|nr:hydrogenase maturation protease [Candidatus Eisenbacteria bacterium]